MPSGENTAHHSSRHLPYSADKQGSSIQHNINLHMLSALRCLGEVVVHHMPEVHHLVDHKRADRVARLSARSNGKQRGLEKKNCEPFNKQKKQGL